MSQTVRAVISRAKGKPVELVDVVIPDPGPGEVVVDVIACGVCHTDLTYRDSGISDDFAAGLVTASALDREVHDLQHRKGATT